MNLPNKGPAFQLGRPGQPILPVRPTWQSWRRTTRNWNQIRPLVNQAAAERGRPEATWDCSLTGKHNLLFIKCCCIIASSYFLLLLTENDNSAITFFYNFRRYFLLNTFLKHAKGEIRKQLEKKIMTFKETFGRVSENFFFFFLEFWDLNSITAD